jgi:arylsulfatase A-like enzyme
MCADRPNILFVMADDHAAHSISAYGSRINRTPFLDRIANEGALFNNCFCTNSICAPSRASILTGTYSHLNGVDTLLTQLDNRLPTFASLLQESGYQTALFGKWHLGHGGLHDPRGFDAWEVIPGQGRYFDPEFIGPNGTRVIEGYITDIVTDLSLEWLDQRDDSRPFCLLVHHKAPHSPFDVDQKHADMYEDVEVPEPDNLRDDYANRSAAASAATMRVGRDMPERDFKLPVPEGFTDDEVLKWKYQRYIKEYIRCVASIDDNVGRLLDYLDAHDLSDNTLVVYTSDQGFFLGDHGWSNKRFMYEESLRMPLLMRLPGVIPGSAVIDQIALNIDFAQTFLELAGIPPLPTMQGCSLLPLLRGAQPKEWRRSMYYRYWMHDDAFTHARAHYGVRTDRYKLIYSYGAGLGRLGASDEIFDPEWELFDREKDPREMLNVYDDPEYEVIRKELEAELEMLQRQSGDFPHHVTS